ncbi:MAG: S46 family peptidase, partial [Thermoguttaceae bacterium]
RRAVMNAIEKESTDRTGLRSDVITLYHGGAYHLYRYKKYTDVRLVFAPQQDIAFFGGDPDNFEYPRYDLDICFFRVYENGRPAKITDYLKWNPSGPKNDELVFVSGNPGRTDRLDTVSHLEFIRDRVMPNVLDRLYRREVVLAVFSQRNAENARRAKDDLFYVCNSRKARLGMLDGLQDPTLIRSRRAAEDALRNAVMNNPQLRASCADAWNSVDNTLKVYDSILGNYVLLEQWPMFQCKLFKIARTLLRMSEETAKPNADRLREFRESNLESVKQELFADTPIYKDLEAVVLADYLSYFLENSSPDDPLAKELLAGLSPRQRAAQLVQGTSLQDVALRKKLAAGGLKAVNSSTDPMIIMVRLLDGPARRVRKNYEQQVEEPLRQAYAKIADARFKLYGTNVYPDATFTLRLAFGQVKGYEEQGKTIPPWTIIAGAYQHAEQHNNQPPFQLPELWLKRKDQLNLDTPMNFVSTVDIIGGNSGSPVINRDAELVGLIFDGNIQSLVWDYCFNDVQGRAVAVDSSVIIEALQKVYDAQALADEILNGRLP